MQILDKKRDGENVRDVKAEARFKLIGEKEKILWNYSI